MPSHSLPVIHGYVLEFFREDFLYVSYSDELSGAGSSCSAHLGVNEELNSSVPGSTY